MSTQNKQHQEKPMILGKKDIVSIVASNTKTSKVKTEEIFLEIFKYIKISLENDYPIMIPNFGRFTKTEKIIETIKVPGISEPLKNVKSVKIKFKESKNIRKI